MTLGHIDAEKIMAADAVRSFLEYFGYREMFCAQEFHKTWHYSTARLKRATSLYSWDMA